MKNNPGYTIWLTGLPSSGKSTVARLLARKLKKQHIPVVVLDGDIIRKHLWNDLGFTKKDRIVNLKRVIFLSKLLTKSNIAVITAFVSPYTSIRRYARRQIKNFIEVYVSCPLDVCRSRDVKGLYKKATSGAVKNFTGISHPYEKPVHPEIIVDTDKLSVTQCANTIVQYILNSKF